MPITSSNGTGSSAQDVGSSVGNASNSVETPPPFRTFSSSTSASGNVTPRTLSALWTASSVSGGWTPYVLPSLQNEGLTSSKRVNAVSLLGHDADNLVAGGGLW